MHSAILNTNGEVHAEIGGDVNLNRTIELYQQGIAILKNQDERHPELPEAYENLAQIHDKLGNTDAAEECRMNAQFYTHDE